MEPNHANEFKVKGEELLHKIKDLVHEGNVRRIIIKDEKGATYVEIPLAFGFVGARLMPVLAALGAMAALASNFTLEVVRRDEGQPESSPSDTSNSGEVKTGKNAK